MFTFIICFLAISNIIINFILIYWLINLDKLRDEIDKLLNK